MKPLQGTGLSHYYWQLNAMVAPLDLYPTLTYSIPKSSFLPHQKQSCSPAISKTTINRTPKALLSAEQVTENSNTLQSAMETCQLK